MAGFEDMIVGFGEAGGFTHLGSQRLHNRVSTGHLYRGIFYLQGRVFAQWVNISLPAAWLQRLRRTISMPTLRAARTNTLEQFEFERLPELNVDTRRLHRRAARGRADRGAARLVEHNAAVLQGEGCTRIGEVTHRGGPRVVFTLRHWQGVTHKAASSSALLLPESDHAALRGFEVRGTEPWPHYLKVREIVPIGSLGRPLCLGQQENDSDC